MMYFTDNYAHGDDVEVTSSGGDTITGHSEMDARDGNKATYWESDGATPSLIIDLGQAQVIDSLWLKQEHITAFSLYCSSDGSTWGSAITGTPVDKGNGIFWFFGFASNNKRYWKIVVTTKGDGNVKIYEVFLMTLRLSQLTDELMPSMVSCIPDDTMGGSYKMGDGSTTSYSGEKPFVAVEIAYQNTTLANRDNLYLLYSTPTLRPPLCVLPDLLYPENIFRVVWADTKFPFDYSNAYQGSGWNGKMSFMEW